MPNKSKYADFVFWHPAKLVKKQKNWDCEIVFNENFNFKLNRYGKNKNVLESVELTSDELIDAYNYL